MMRLRFKRAWRRFPEGAEVERDDGVANLLIARGICEEVRELEAAVASPARLEAAAMRTPISERGSRKKR